MRKNEKTPIRAHPTTPPTTPPAMPATLVLDEEEDGVGVGEVLLVVEGRLLFRGVVALVKWVIWKSDAIAGEVHFVDMLQ